MRKRMIRLPAIGFALALTLSACGGAASEAPASGAPATPGDSSAPVDSQAPDGATPGTDPDVGPLNTAVVTIDGERLAFTDVQCSIFTAGYIQAGNFGADPEVDIALPPDGWESQGDTFRSPSIKVTIGEEFAGGKIWLADAFATSPIAPIPAGTSQIDSYNVPDTRPVKATGTATFIDLAAHHRGEKQTPVTGTFEVSCP